MPCALISWMIEKICCTSSGARPSEGSSSRSSRGCAISARPIASICCSPPESVPAFWREALAQPREQRERALVGDSHRAGRRRYAPIWRFSRTVRLAKMRRPSGTCEIPRATRRSARSAVMSAPSNQIRPERGRSSPLTARRSVDLPAPFEPISVDDLARLHLEVDAAQREDRAVGDRERLDAQQRRARRVHALAAASSEVPRYASITRGSRRTSSGGPSAIFSPWSSTRHALAEVHHERDVVIDQHDAELRTRGAAAGSAGAAPPSRRDSCRRRARRAAAGAAASRARARSRAGAARRRAASRRAPPRSGRGRGARAARAPAPRSGFAASARRRRAGRRRATSGARRRSAARTFSSTVSERNRRMFWNVRAMPRRQTWCAGRPSMRSPSKTRRPRVGRADAGDHVEGGGLAGAVRTDHRDELAARPRGDRASRSRRRRRSER